jgi:hypothetical protein
MNRNIRRGIAGVGGGWRSFASNRALACCLAIAALLLPLAALAQSPESYAYCTVEDTGNREIWVSQVFAVPASTRPLGLELATQFHTHVGGLGGAGNKQCVVAPRADVEATRAKIYEIMNKRVFGMRVYKWHDVQWTPSVASLADAPPIGAAAPQQVYCRTTDTDARTMVTTPVFQSSMPGPADSAHYVVLDRYAKAFAQHASSAYGVAPEALCIASDTRAEADKSLDDYRHAFPFQRLKTIEAAWTPDPALATVPALPAVSMAKAAPPAAMPPVAAPAVRAGKATAHASADDDVEAEFWRRISNSGQAADYQDYLAAYPQGRHAPIARLEARRLAGAAAAPPIVQTPVAAPSGARDTVAMDPTIAQRIASEPFFRLPAGSGDSVERSGTRTIGTVPVRSTSRVQRVPGSTVCRFHNVASAGASETTYDGDTWAGLLPLLGTIRSRGPYGATESVARTLAVTAVDGQPFPLVEGNSFGYSVAQTNIDRVGNRHDSTFAYRCTVGRTGLAGAVVPELAGEQTELQCTMTFDNPAVKPMTSNLRWYSAAGCFLQDPDR